MDPLLARLLDEAEARQLPALIADWQDADDARQWLARALRIDLPLLLERPALVLPALYRRCATFGRDDAFFRRSWHAVHSQEASEYVTRWLSERPPASWLRSLWPPEVPLDAGVVEEYRTGLAGELRFSESGDLVGVVGDDSVAWERVTGRRVAVHERLVAHRAERAGWQLAKDARPGTAGFVATNGRRVELALDNYDDPNSVDELSPEIVILRCLDSDGYSYYLVDLAQQHIVLRGRGYSGSGIARGDRGYFVARGTVHAFAGGEVIGTWSAPPASELVIAPDGMFAMRTAHVIRIWDPELAIAAAVERTLPRVTSEVTWSPDGALLATGGTLAEPTGRIIASLPISSGEDWLEGGPPRNYQALTNAGFVEACGSLRVWDGSGALVVQDEDRGGFMRDGVAIDPLGRCLAIYRGGRLVVSSLLTGSVLVAREVTIANKHRYEYQLGFSERGELWWEIETGERYLLDVDSRITRVIPELPGWRTEPRLDADDGLLVIDDLALPIDDAQVVRAPDGGRYAGTATLVELQKR